MPDIELSLARRRRSFIVRVWGDEQGRCWGHVADPAGEWKAAFSTSDELWQALLSRLSPPRPGPPANEGD